MSRRFVGGGWLARLALVALSTAALLPVTVAAAQPSTNEARQDALKLAGEAMDLFQAGDYAAALDKFNQADALVPAPTLKLRIARCLDKLDRMKEAAEKYREVIATELTRTAPAQHREARKQAVPDLAALLDEMPSVTVTVTGVDSADAQVSLEGTPLPVEMVGNKQQMDPGRYVFEAVVGERRVKKDVVLGRGDDVKVQLELPAVQSDTPTTPGAGEPESSSLATVGWAGVALGGAALSVGSILGVVVLSTRADLEARCPDRRCLPDQHADARAFNNERIASTVMLVAGGVIAATGIVLVLVAPSPSGSPPGSDTALFRPSLHARLGPAGATFGGTF